MSLSVFVVAVLPFTQSASIEIAREEQARLNTCIQNVDVAPNEAYEDSLAWLSTGNRPKARYCNAIALLALERFEEGAERLAALANAPEPIALEDRAIYLTQAGNAWLTANYPDAAAAAFTEAMKIDKHNPDLMKDRAAAYLLLERWVEGVDDLNAALEIVPNDSEALAMRARAHLESGNLIAAEADMQDARAGDPENIDILVLRGEIREAKRLRSLEY